MRHNLNLSQPVRSGCLHSYSCDMLRSGRRARRPGLRTYYPGSLPLGFHTPGIHATVTNVAKLTSISSDPFPFHAVLRSVRSRSGERRRARRAGLNNSSCSTRCGSTCARTRATWPLSSSPICRCVRLCYYYCCTWYVRKRSQLLEFLNRPRQMQRYVQ